ncbi:MAG TPA: hypothetical protein VK164_01075 [Flavobacterium sp.]|uniref:hypothetical protein n=1 Tax=Flavobacterium sp. TaxID=239 RepID=UPI002B4B1121|nr:hypothetical protein [Flavobacterium sp.]HLO72503.1 hypothetical protein [Flavobacterium sp.]
MIKVIIVIISLFLVSCDVNESDLHNTIWKIYKKNSHDFGDVISFDDIVVKNDTIFLNLEPIYEIIEYKNRYFMDEFITIKNLKTQNLATYIKK